MHENYPAWDHPGPEEFKTLDYGNVNVTVDRDEGKSILFHLFSNGFWKRADGPTISRIIANLCTYIVPNATSSNAAFLPSLKSSSNCCSGNPENVSIKYIYSANFSAKWLNTTDNFAFINAQFCDGSIYF